MTLSTIVTTTATMTIILTKFVILMPKSAWKSWIQVETVLFWELIIPRHPHHYPLHCLDHLLPCLRWVAKSPFKKCLFFWWRCLKPTKRPLNRYIILFFYFQLQLGCPPQQQSYHPHSIFYGQHYHRIQPVCNGVTGSSSTFGVTCNNFLLNNVPIQLTDTHRHSGSSFRSSNTQSPPSMMDEEPETENPYECIPPGGGSSSSSFPPRQQQPQEAVTRFDN